MRTFTRASSTVIAVVMILGLPASLLAQGIGAISGTVSDTTRGVSPGATRASAPRQAQRGVKFVW